jgi:protein-tyrosine phosphatase
MIDIHTHLLPGVDDGSPSIDVSVSVLERFARDGVEVVVCTPHLDASRAANAPYERFLALLGDLRAAAPALPRLELGWEIMLDMPDVPLIDARLGLAQSSAVLVEFPRTGVPLSASTELYRLKRSGIRPVLAHPERYWGCTPEKVDEWRRAGAVIQMDAAGPVASSRVAVLAQELLELGLVDVLASDTHGDDRSLAPTRQWLEELGAAEQLELLTRENAARLLRNEPPVPVPPIARPRGMFGRLRDLVFGRA